MATTAGKTGARTDATTVKTGARTDETAASERIPPRRDLPPPVDTSTGWWEVPASSTSGDRAAGQRVVFTRSGRCLIEPTWEPWRVREHDGLLRSPCETEREGQSRRNPGGG